MEKKQLLPCPFCGCTDMKKTCDDYVFILACAQCKASIDGKTEDDVEQFWNRRSCHSSWINVSDKMPPDDYDVLSAHLILYPTVHIDRFSEGRFYDARDNEHVTQWVTHWMPLPEPPEYKND